MLYELISSIVSKSEAWKIQTNPFTHECMHRLHQTSNKILQSQEFTISQSFTVEQSNGWKLKASLVEFIDCVEEVNDSQKGRKSK